MEEKDKNNPAENREESVQDDGSGRDRFESHEEPVQEAVSFSDEADLIDQADRTETPLESDTASQTLNSSHDNEETELPLIGGKPCSTTKKISLSDSDAADNDTEERIRTEDSDVQVELDESLVDRKNSLDDAEIDSAEFGFVLESEEESISNTVVRETVVVSDAGDNSIEDSSPSKVTPSEHVELDVDLNFPEVLIALSNDSRVEPVAETATGSDYGNGPDQKSGDTSIPDDAPSAKEDQAGAARDSEAKDVKQAPSWTSSHPTLPWRFADFRQKKLTLPMPTLALVILLLLAVLLAFMLGTRGPYLKQPGVAVQKAPTGVVVQDSQSVSGVIQNDIEGPIFVIKGRLKNASQETLQDVRVTGRLFDRWDFFKVETVTSGTELSDLELKQLDAATIRKRLSTPGGSDAVDLSIPPGHEIPFLIVFFDLPEDLNQLDRFTVDIGTDPIRDPGYE